MNMNQTQSFILAVAVASTTLMAQEQPMGRPQGHPDRAMLERLKLTDEQRNQVEKLRTEYQKQQISQRSKLQTSQLDLRQLMRSDNPDKAAIEKKINEASQLGAQARIARFNQMLSMKKILTPEQQKMLREGMKMRMQGGMAGPRKRMGGQMRPPQGRRFQNGPGMQRFQPRREF